MSIDISRVGQKIVTFLQQDTTFSTAQIAAVDSAAQPLVGNYSPYAASATANEQAGSIRVVNADAAGAVIAAAQRFSVGVFFTPEVNKANMGYEVSGVIRVNSIAAHEDGFALGGGFFQGRKATNNTITSSKASVNNTLYRVTSLPCSAVLSSERAASTGFKDYLLEWHINRQLFFNYDPTDPSAQFVPCFGMELVNAGAGSTPTLQFEMSLHVVKYTKPLNMYRLKGSS